MKPDAETVRHPAREGDLETGSHVMQALAAFARRLVDRHNQAHPENIRLIAEAAKRGTLSVRVLDLLGDKPRIELIATLDGQEFDLGFQELRRVPRGQVH